MRFRTTAVNKKVYSVDLMFAYINIFKPNHLIMNMIDFNDPIMEKCWYYKKTKISPNAVLKNPKKYKDEYDRIINADLKYPIIVFKNKETDIPIILDGIHRYIKSKLLGRKKIKTYIFDGQLMKKFIINNNDDYKAVSNIDINEYIELFNKRFYS